MIPAATGRQPQWSDASVVVDASNTAGQSAPVISIPVSRSCVIAPSAIGIVAGVSPRD